MSDAYEQSICAWDEMFLPLYVRPGSIIPVGAHEDTVQYDYALDVDWRIFALEEGQERTCVICGMDGQEEASLTVTHTTEGYALHLTGGRSCTVTLMNVAAQITCHSCRRKYFLHMIPPRSL